MLGTRTAEQQKTSGTGVHPSTKPRSSGSNRTKQNSEACAVGAKMTTIKGRSPTWGNLGKGSERIQAQIPEEPEKGMSEWGGAQHKFTKN